MIKRILVSLLMVLCIVSHFSVTLKADEDTDTVSGNVLLNLDGKNPEGYDPNDDSNPYDASKDKDGTVAIEWNELSLSYQNEEDNASSSAFYNNMDPGSPSGEYRYVKNWKNALSLQTDASPDMFNLNHVHTVAADLSGVGRKNYVVYLGHDTGNHLYKLVSQSANAGSSSYNYEKMTFVTSGAENDDDGSSIFAVDKYSEVFDLFNGMNFLDVAAGDFDGDGIDTIVTATTYTFWNHAGVQVVISEYAYDPSSGFNRIGKSLVHMRSGYYTCVSLAAGDIDGDGIDDLVVAYGRAHNAPHEEAQGRLYAYYGKEGESGGILSNGSKLTSLTHVLNEGGTNYEVNFTSIMAAIGDVDGDKQNEVIVGGYRLESTDGGAYKDRKQQLLGVYKTNSEKYLTEKVFAKANFNTFSESGYYSSDNVHPRVALSAVAFNGQNRNDHIFLNGSIYDISTYNASDHSINSIYNPEYLNHTDRGAGSYTISNTYISDVAVGNFDRNAFGRQQVYFVVVLKTSGSRSYSYKVGMIGSTYNDNIEQSVIDNATGASFFCNDIDSDEYIMLGRNSYQSGRYVTNFANLTAVDRDVDGIRMRYVDKKVLYSDPKIEAVLQAAPYFEDINAPGETEYEITTSYGEASHTTKSLDWGVGFSGEITGGALGKVRIATDLGAVFNKTWEFEKGWTTSYGSSFTAIEHNTVILQRTPIVMYYYDLYDNETGKWILEGLTVPQPLGPIWSQLSVKEYNSFVDEYNAYVENLKNKNPDVSVQKSELRKIESSPYDDTALVLLNNEGDPGAYFKDWNQPSVNAKKLSSDADMSLDYSGGNKKQSWSFEESSQEGEGFSGGLAFSVTVQGGFDILAAEAYAGVKADLQYMQGTCKYTTKAKNNAVSGLVNDIDEIALRSKGITTSTIRSYGFRWSFGRWYIPLGNLNNALIPVFGYVVNNVACPPQPVVDLDITYDDENDRFTLDWDKPSVSDNYDVYYVYQVVGGKDYVLINSEPIDKETLEYTFEHKGLDESAGNLFTFVVTTARIRNDQVLESIWSNEVNYAISANGKSAYEVAVDNGFEGSEEEWLKSLIGEAGEKGNGIKEITKTGTSGLIDTYTILFDDGSKTLFTVSNGEKGEQGIQGEQGLQGEPGKQIELKYVSEEGALYWKYEGEDETQFRKLMAVSDDLAIQGPKGDKGDPGMPGQDGKKVILRYNEESKYAEWQNEGDSEWHQLARIEEIAKGEDGQDGREIELRNNNGTVEWSYKTEEEEQNWNTLIALEEISGSDGNDGRTPEFATETAEDGHVMVRWKYTDEEKWKTLYDFPAPEEMKGERGESGRGIASIGLQSRQGTVDIYVIRYTDGSQSTFAVTNGKDGAQGERGPQGESGVQGPQGIKGQDGRDGQDGVSAGLSMADLDTSNYKGRDGVGVKNVELVDNSFIFYMTDGSAINAGSLKIPDLSEATKQKRSGRLDKSSSVSMYYFALPYDEKMEVSVNNSTMPEGSYVISEFGDGVIVTIRDNAVPADGEYIKITSGSNSDISLIKGKDATDKTKDIALWSIIAALAAAIAGTWIFFGNQIRKLKKSI